MNHMLLIQSISIVAAIIAIIVFFLIYSRDPEGLRKIKFLDRTDIIIMTVITLVYAGISIINLGSFYKYENPWHGKKGDELIIVPNQAIHGMSLSYYVGISNEAKYSVLGVRLNGKEDVISPILLERDSNVLQYGKYLPPYYFSLSWMKTRESDIPVKYKKMIIKVDSGELNISKMFISDKGNHIFNEYNITDKKSQKNYNYLKSPIYIDYVNTAFLYNAVFDEVYYPIAAYQYLQGGIGYVGQHPQLGIFLIGAGIHFFGMSPFGWRCMDWLSGVVLVTFMYVFAKKLFGDKRVAISASVLMSTEFMHFVMTRVGMIESFFVLFVFIECFFLYEYLDLRSCGVSYKIASQRLLCAMIFLGLAVSCKWSALFSVPAILATIFYAEARLNKFNWKNILTSMLLAILALAIYIITYIIPATILKIHNLFKFVYLQQKIMLGIVSFKAYTTKIKMLYNSIWWKWPFNLETLNFCNPQRDIQDPYFLYRKHPSHESLVLLFANPLIAILTYLVMIFLAYNFLKHRKNCKESGFILVIILSMFLPYAFVSRSTMLYYFYSVLPFVILGVSAVINRILLLKDKKWNYFIKSYILLNIGIFALYYPILSGMLLNTGYIYFLYDSILYLNLFCILFILFGSAIVYKISNARFLVGENPL